MIYATNEKKAINGGILIYAYGNDIYIIISISSTV